jgi:hypothetical protein
MSRAEELQRLLAERKPFLDRWWSVPAPGTGAVLDAPDPENLSEQAIEFFGSDPRTDPIESVSFGNQLLDCVRDVVRGLTLTPSDCAREAWYLNSIMHDVGLEPLGLDASIVCSIRHLWDAIYVGRFGLRAWREDISHARQFKPFRCVLGPFSSATEAIQDLAETVLELLWLVGRYSVSHDESFIAIKDPFAAFDVDWWYSSLPAIRDKCAGLGRRFRLGPRLGRDLWRVAVEHELTAVRRRWSPSSAVAADPGGPKGEEGEEDNRKGSERSKLPPAREKAYQQFQWAVQQDAALEGATDRDVYEWLKEKLDEDDKLPSFASWSKYVRDARKIQGVSKHTSRAGRTGRSIVTPDQI